MAKRNKKGICVYCGKLKILTREHVVPRCLFPTPPMAPVIIPVCRDCNNDKSKIDDYLRDMLVLESSRHAPAAELLHGPVSRSASRNLSAVVRAAKSKAKYEPVHSPGGIYLGHAYTFPLEEARVNRAFSLMVRGLYYKLTGLYLPQDCVFTVRRLTASEFNEFWTKLKEIGYNGPYRLGDDVFTCLFIYAAEEPAISQWWLWFYDTVCVTVGTVPNGYDPNALVPVAT